MKQLGLKYFFRIIMLVIATALIGIYSVRVYAADDTTWQEDYEYEVCDEYHHNYTDGSVDIVKAIVIEKYIGKGGDVIIPSEAVINGQTYKVVVYADTCSFFSEDNITSVLIKEGVIIEKINFVYCEFCESSNPSYLERTNLKSITFEKTDSKWVNDLSYMCYQCIGLTEIDLSGLDTSEVYDMSFMFQGCKNLSALDLASLNTDKVKEMQYMFAWCEHLKELDLSSFNTDNVTNMAGMFLYCSELTYLDISSFNTKNVDDMSSMFSGCHNLLELDVSHFDTRNVTNMLGMFSDTWSISNLDVSGFYTDKVTDMRGMFSLCGAYTLDLSNFVIKNCETDRMLADDRMPEHEVRLSRIKSPKQLENNSCEIELPSTMYILNHDYTTDGRGIFFLDEVSAGTTIVDSNKPVMPDFSEFVTPQGCVFQFRLYNPNSGEHFYTGSQEESIILVKAGWKFEGPGFITPKFGDAIYRLYDNKCDHLYTMDEDEKALLESEGWLTEGVAFPSATESEGRPMYRLKNPNATSGTHHFTMSAEERDHLVDIGWIYEGIGWYSV